MVKKNKIRKEDIAEDWCFVCKDGGLLMVCDHRDCRKTYHPRCVDKDDSFSENGSKWTCSSHFCFLCHKASKFKCFCCPKAICEKCIYDAEFVTVKGNKGFCSHCSKLALLIEDDADNDSDGELVDFKDQDTYEFLFSEYYEFIKEEEGLNSEHVHSAHRFFKNGKRKCDLDPDEMGLGVYGSGDSEDVSNYIVSDCEDLNYTAGSMSGRTKKGLGKLKSMKGNGEDKKKEFIGWGSRSLMEFLEYIGKDTSNEFSEHDVTSIIIEYCRENNLFDPRKKRKIHCDAPLRSLLGRKSVNRNSMQNLLAQHFAENFEEMGDISSSSEDRDYNESSNFSRKRKSISCTKSHNLNIVCEEHQSCFAAIVSSNLKLVYLKRSLVDELSKQPQTFDDKVLGSYVRIKTDQYDYLQKNSHLLVQVVGINTSLRNDEFNKEIMLQLSYVPKNVPISKISDDDFSEEECQDLYQRMRNGLLKQPTVLELEQKARSLHEDIMKHWISRKLVLLQNRIDHANEKGWRRELDEYIDQKLKLQTQLEQSRLLNDIPKVIPEIVDTTLSQEGSPRIDKVEQNGLSELASGQTCNSVGHHSKHSGFAHSLNNRTDVAGKMVRSRGKDDSIIKHGHVQHGVSTLMHGHLAIELGNIPNSNGQLGTCTPAFVDGHQSVPHSSAPLSSNHASVPRIVGEENVVRCPTFGHSPSRLSPHHKAISSPHATTTPLHPVRSYSCSTDHHSWGLAVQPIVAPSAHTVLAPSVHINPAPQVQTTSAPPVEPIHDASIVHDLPDEKVQRDANGRVIIRPVGKGWTPNHHAIEAIGHAIRSQFRGPYHHYEAMSEEAKLRWWTEFKTRVTWAPHDEWQIIKVYESKVRKRLCDMLGKARVKGSRPTWIGEEAWGELLNYWDTQKFKDKSSQNKINRSSVRGGALHSSGRKSHLDIALGLERKYGRPVEPDELFLATHTNKKGDWIDGRSRETYETYHEQLRMMQSKSSKGSISDVPPIDAATKLRCWKDVAGGKSRGRVYGTADLAANFRHGALSLTQPSVLASTIDRDEQFAQNAQLRHQILEATERANQADQRTAELKETVRLMQQQLAMMMERYVADTSIDTSYSLFQAVIAAMTRPSTMPRAWTFFLLDQVLTYIVLAAGAVSTEVLYLAENGNTDTTWSSACGSFAVYGYAFGCFPGA